MLVRELKLSAPAQRALAGAEIINLDDFTKFTEAEIANLHGIGPNVLDKIRQAMTDRNLRFTDS